MSAAVVLVALAGVSLGLLGIGGSILIVPLLVYGLDLAPHAAIGTSTVAATVSGLWSLLIHARAVTPRAPTALSGARLAGLAAAGFGVGSLAGLVGVGGGFLTVPALAFIAGLPLLGAFGTSMISVSAVAGTTAVSYASAHLVAWPIAGLLMAGGMLGGYVGVRLAAVLGARKRALTVLFSAVVAAAGLYMMAHALR